MKLSDSIEKLLIRTIPHATSYFIKKNGSTIAKSIEKTAEKTWKELLKIAFK